VRNTRCLERFKEEGKIDDVEGIRGDEMDEMRVVHCQVACMQAYLAKA
jgi:hypothetical protein